MSDLENYVRRLVDILDGRILGATEVAGAADHIVALRATSRARAFEAAKQDALRLLEEFGGDFV